MYEYSTNLTGNQWQVIEKIINAQERVKNIRFVTSTSRARYIQPTSAFLTP